MTPPMTIRSPTRRETMNMRASGWVLQKLDHPRQPVLVPVPVLVLVPVPVPVPVLVLVLDTELRPAMCAYRARARARARARVRGRLRVLVLEGPPRLASSAHTAANSGERRAGDGDGGFQRLLGIDEA